MCFPLVPTSVTLNDLERRNIALILRYFTKFDRLGGRLRHNGWRQTYKVRCKISSSSYILAKTGTRGSRTVSLRQLSFWLINDYRMCLRYNCSERITNVFFVLAYFVFFYFPFTEYNCRALSFRCSVVIASPGLFCLLGVSAMVTEL